MVRPTARGVGVLVVALTATVVGTRFGQQGLAAIAAPLFVAFLGAAGQVALTGTPTVERSSVRRGFAGEQREVALSVGGSGIARITDQRPEAVGGPATVTRSLPTTAALALPYDRRGEHELGPVEIRLTDALGLVRRSVTVDATDGVLVYPPVERIGGADGFLRGASVDDERGAFDRLREYAPGDPMRDIHWKSSAKRDELLVAEFDEPTGSRELWVGARAAEGHADAMAAAAATVAVGALRAGFAVGLATPGGTVQPGHGDAHRTRLLETLARTPGGDCGRETDVVVSADDEGVGVTVDGETRAFEQLRAGSENPLAGGHA
jgi:uncharacterized protein (DUF58 family)